MNKKICNIGKTFTNITNIFLLVDAIFQYKKDEKWRKKNNKKTRIEISL